MTTKEMSDFLNSLWCWARCTEEEQRKLSEIADYLSSRGNEKNDCISRKAVQTRLKEIINEMETIFADIREREVNDSVCGLCEYDCDHGLDGFANECPGFEKDDCFKLNEKYKAEWLDISNIPSITPQEPQSFKWCTDCKEYDQEKHCCHRYSKVIRNTVAEIRQELRWIPVSERLPKDLEPVNITWINHDPEPYYNDIKDKPFAATGVYFNGQWYWWSTLCADVLAEYSHNYDDIIDNAIEVTAWMPLPKPYKADKGQEDGKV